jgi:uncharacterized protein (TIGR03067 family)
MSGFHGGIDRDTGESMPWVKDENGVSYCEMGHCQMVVRTNTAPWQLDLTKKKKDGELIVKKGICQLNGDELKLSIGEPGKNRPTSFDDPGFNGDYTVFTASRFNNNED